MCLTLHELLYAASTGFNRPHPVAPFGEECVAVPVLVALYHAGCDTPFALLPAEGYATHGRNGQPARFVIRATFPDPDESPAGGGSPAAEPPPPEPAAPPPFDGSTGLTNTRAGWKNPPPPGQGGSPDA